ncbi:hypothetical protein [Myxococcus xanthus]|uniref:hypothetical protein n=1 Tax=Myxococcus xanthus TaxID=34 RepID=UPI0002FBFB00|nr:hypothetical protein [Myxococcus xanthus]NOJ56064.1 hypothetical protein [Myxococcus xanthus]QPM82979.1 hypothetical protein I5Q59_17660 [Myxococcus xanthus]QVW65285.1 hypothetical protein JTM82_23005 [Myxococcus xanthus DZ2]UEO01647.1 hypothetical protein K1515_19785 [Myxococcus xanthus DZ2]UYI18169.1 hypothetical protein N3T43_18215 [Myxococcus xanthus]
MARSSHIYPSVRAMFERGQVVNTWFDSVDELAETRSGSLHCSEKALLNMLDTSRQRRRRADH